MGFEYPDPGQVTVLSPWQAMAISRRWLQVPEEVRRDIGRQVREQPLDPPVRFRIDGTLVRGCGTPLGDAARQTVALNVACACAAFRLVAADPGRWHVSIRRVVGRPWTESLGLPPVGTYPVKRPSVEEEDQR